MNQPPEDILKKSVELCSPHEVDAALMAMAAAITQKLEQSYPLVLCVMSGAVVFTGRLLPLLRFPLQFDYVHATRYRGQTSGGDIEWRRFPDQAMHGRTVLVLDDILDEGHTLAAIRERCLAAGASAFFCAVLVEKMLGSPKPIEADFTGIRVPDQYVFGCGMDVNDLWRNLPGIYALRE